MATQQEVIKYIENQFETKFNEDGLCAMRFDVGGGRSQAVVVMVSEHAIFTSSPFARVGSITDTQALDVASGAQPIWRSDDLYFTSKSMMLETIDPEEIHSIIGLTCGLADSMEKEFGFSDEF